MESKSNIVSILPRALTLYDKNMERYREVFKQVEREEFQISDLDMEPNRVTFYDKDGNVILTSAYELLSNYNHFHKLWTWSWAIPIVRKNLTYKARELLKYGLDLVSREFSYLKAEFITSRFQVTHPMQLEIHSALAAYLTRTPLVYKYKMDLPTLSGEPNYQINFLFLQDVGPGKKFDLDKPESIPNSLSSEEESES